MAAVVRRRVVVTGRVQGVGFRYEAQRRASHRGLAGFVANCPSGVCLEVEGPADAVAQLISSFSATPPRFARIQAVLVTPLEVRGGDTAAFVIAPDVPDPPP